MTTNSQKNARRGMETLRIATTELKSSSKPKRLTVGSPESL
jgi:hypothetical protein